MQDILSGRIYKFGDNVNSDIIIAGRYLIYIDPVKLAEHAFIREALVEPGQTEKDSFIQIPVRDGIKTRQIVNQHRFCHGWKIPLKDLDAQFGQDQSQSVPRAARGGG